MGKKRSQRIKILRPSAAFMGGFGITTCMSHGFKPWVQTFSKYLVTKLRKRNAKALDLSFSA